MAEIKTIQFYDLTEVEILELKQSDNYLTIRFVGKDLTALIGYFNDTSKTKEIKYFVDGNLTEIYSNYIIYVSSADVLSGLVEVSGNIQTVVIRKKTLEERVKLLEERLEV